MSFISRVVYCFENIKPALLCLNSFTYRYLLSYRYGSLHGSGLGVEAVLAGGQVILGNFSFFWGGEQKGKHCVLFKNWFWEVFIMILTKITKKVVSKNINKLSFVKYRYLVLITFCYKKNFLSVLNIKVI